MKCYSEIGGRFTRKGDLRVGSNTSPAGRTVEEHGHSCGRRLSTAWRRGPELRHAAGARFRLSARSEDCQSRVKEPPWRLPGTGVDVVHGARTRTRPRGMRCSVPG